MVNSGMASIFLLFQPSTLLERLGNNPLKLPIGGAELIRRPCLYCIHRLCVNSQHERLGLYLFVLIHALVVQRS